MDMSITADELDNLRDWSARNYPEIIADGKAADVVSDELIYARVRLAEAAKVCEDEHDLAYIWTHHVEDAIHDGRMIGYADGEEKTIFAALDLIARDSSIAPDSDAIRLMAALVEQRVTLGDRPLAEHIVARHINNVRAFGRAYRGD